MEFRINGYFTYLLNLINGIFLRVFSPTDPKLTFDPAPSVPGHPSGAPVALVGPILEIS